jgi:hypothetical protein
MNTRKHDIEELRKEYNYANKDEREKIEETAQKIRYESKKIESMRERLIKAHKDRNREEIKDINDWVSSHKDYRNG